jgi:hypothetical protein
VPWNCRPPHSSTRTWFGHHFLDCVKPAAYQAAYQPVRPTESMSAPPRTGRAPGFSMALKESERRTWAQSGLNARDWASQNACLIGGGYFIHARFRPTDRSPPIWGSRGRRFKSRQPDNTMADCHAGSDPRSSGHRAILDMPQCQGVGPRLGTPARVRHSASRTLLRTLGEWTRVLDQEKAFEPAGSPRTGSKPRRGL